MSKGIPHKDQHWIPQSYLKAWADPDATEAGAHVWRFSKDGERSSKKAPKGIFFEEDLYTIRLADGTRDLTVEHGLAGLESEFVGIRDTVLAQNKPLDARQDLLLRAFIAAMHSRTRAHLDHWQRQFRSLRDQMDRNQHPTAAAEDELEGVLPGLVTRIDKGSRNVCRLSLLPPSQRTCPSLASKR